MAGRKKMTEAEEFGEKKRGRKKPVSSSPIKKPIKSLNLSSLSQQLPPPPPEKTFSWRGSIKKFWKLFLSLGILLIFAIFYLLLPGPALLSAQQNSVAETGEMRLEFSQAMKEGSVLERLRVSPALQGQWHLDGKVLAFQPEQPLKLGEWYRVDLDRGARSRLGKALKNNFSFYFAVTGPPHVNLVTPDAVQPPPDLPLAEEGSVELSPFPIIDLHQPIRVFFDQAMDFSEMSSKPFLITKPSVEGELALLNSRAFEFTPKGGWPAQSTIELTVPKALRAQNGLSSETSLSWKVQTPGQRIVRVHPDPSLPVALNQAFEITFQLPVDLNQVRPGENVQLFPSNDVDAAAAEKRDGFFNTEVTQKEGDPLTLIFKPEPAYQPEKEYELLFKAGLAELKEDVRFKFRTPSSLEGEAPSSMTSSFWPQDKSLDVFPAQFAPKFTLKTPLKAPFGLQLCKLPPEVNPFSLPFLSPSDKPPCTAEEKRLEAFSSGILPMGDLYPEESWENGLYWLKVSDAQQNQALQFFMLSDTTLILKRAGDDLLVWALDRLTQEPVPRMEVQVYSPAGKELARGVTDGSGIYKRNQPLSPAVYVLGRKTLEGENRWSVATDQWPVPSDWDASAIKTSPEVYLLTDRNQLSAGETLKVQGIRRTLTQRGYTLPFWGEITLKLFNFDQKEVFSTVLPLAQEASFFGEITLPPELLPGVYSLQAFEGEKLLSTLPTPLQVTQGLSFMALHFLEEPDFSHPKPRAIVQLRDEHGLPGGASPGRWQLFEHNTFNPLHTQLIAQGEFEFDARGQGKFALFGEGENLLKPNFSYSLEIQAEGQAVPARLLHSFDHEAQIFPVQITLDHALLEENSALQGYLLSSEEKPLSSVELKLYALGEKAPLWEREVEITSPRQRFDYNDLILPELESGQYLLKAMEGRRSLSAPHTLFVVKDLGMPLSDKLAVFLSHSRRKVNTPSKLLLNVPDASADAPKTVLLSYEQAGLLDYDVVVAEHPLNVIDFKVQPNMSPGVYLSALTIGYEAHPRMSELKKQLRQLYDQRQALEELLPENRAAQEAAINAQLEVLEAERRQLRSGLSVQVEAAQAYLPVEETRKALYLKSTLEPSKTGPERVVQLKVLDEAGAPVPAGITLFLRPKAHFFLSPLDYFLSLPPFNVSTHSNLFLNSKQAPASSSPSQEFKTLISPFQALAYSVFEPLLPTDEAGALTYSFTLPKKGDWELVAFAQAPNNQWGSTRLDLSEPSRFLLKPVLPAVLSAGDRTQLQVELQNTSNQTWEGPLTLDLSGVEVEGPRQQQVLLEAGKHQILVWPLWAKEGEDKGEVKVTFQNQTELHSLTLYSSTKKKKPEGDSPQVFLSFRPQEGGENLNQFKQGKSYQGKLLLVFPRALELSEPLPLRIPLPAGLKLSKWLSPPDLAAWAEQEKKQASFKGITWIPNAIWTFDQVIPAPNQIELRAKNVPAGSYEFEFEMQAVWPGHFKMPPLQWGNELFKLEEGEAVRVE